MRHIQINAFTDNYIHAEFEFDKVWTRGSMIQVKAFSKENLPDAEETFCFIYKNNKKLKIFFPKTTEKNCRDNVLIIYEEYLPIKGGTH